MLVTEVLQKMVKQRRESIEMYTKGGRAELAAAEAAEVAVIEGFLPAQMDEAALDGGDRRDRRGDRGGVGEGHGPGDGAGEGAPCRRGRHGQGQRGGEGAVVRMSGKGDR